MPDAAYSRSLPTPGTIDRKANEDRSSGRPASGKPIDAVAQLALSMVARTKSGDTRRLDPDHLAHLKMCVLTGDMRSCRRTVQAMIESGLSREEIADHYVPALARHLGEDWCADKLSFTDVTIGTSRLQVLLRDLGPEWRADHSARAETTSALVLQHAEENHTLGAQVLAGQFRRLGFSVKLAVCSNRAEVAALMCASRYDIVTISFSRQETLELVRELVNFVRTAVQKAPPIVVGGCFEGRGSDIAAYTGADHVTNSLDEALRLCGLTKFNQEDEGLTRRR